MDVGNTLLNEPIRRTKQACTNCRRKKARCTGERPRCYFCARLSQNCVYERRTITQRPEATHANSHSASGSSEYAFLVAKVEALDTKLTNLSNSVNGFLTTASLGEVIAEPQCNPFVTNDREFLNSESESVRHALHHIPSDVLHSLLDDYFLYCHNQPYSFFHEASLRQKLANGELPEHLLFAIAANAIRFSQNRFFSWRREEAMDNFAAKAWKSLVLNWMTVDEEPSLDIVKSITLLSLIDFTAGKSHQAWMKIGLSIRLAQDLRLTINPPQPVSPMVEEDRRRVFWSIYLLDKVISVGIGRPPALLDEDCHISLPSDEAAFRSGKSSPTSSIQRLQFPEGPDTQQPSAFASVVIGASVLCSCTRYLLRDSSDTREKPPWNPGSTFAKINSRLLDLESRLEVFVPISKIFERKCIVGGAVDQQIAGHWLFSATLFRLCRCLLHHPLFLHTRLRSYTARASSTFRRFLFESSLPNANAVSDLLQDAKGLGCNAAASFYACCLAIAGSVQALYTQHGQQSICQLATDKLASTMAFLEKLSRYWRHASYILTNLQGFAENVSVYRELLDPDYQLVLDASKLENIWCLVDYSAMSRERLRANGHPKSPELFGFLSSPGSVFNDDDYQMGGLLPDNVVGSLFESLYTLTDAS